CLLFFAAAKKSRCRPAQGRRVEHANNSRMPAKAKAKANRECQRKARTKSQTPPQSPEQPHHHSSIHSRHLLE
ncbi:hypothetical protein, partial [Paraburkholderia caribensis]|uniref:hypothetical protein n=1 Tax=Paraburkholderia caribensis TaxID=75105 RepID=UPI002091A687